MRRQTKAYIYALATVFIWSTVASAFKLSLRHMGPSQLLLASAWTSTLVLGLITVLQGKSASLARWRVRDYLVSAGLGLLNPFAYYLILFKAYALLPAQVAQPLNYTWAVTLSLLAVPLLGQPLRLADLAGLLLSYAGAYLIATQGPAPSEQSAHLLGLGLALGSTLIWSLYWILNTKDRLDPTCRLTINFAFGALLITVFAAWTQNLAWPGWPGLFGAAYVGVFEMGISFVLWAKALRLSPSAARISILIYLSPFLSLVFIHLLVGETILAPTLAGLALIVAGIGLQQVQRA
jgi:drug/metabolite transporter (DMT)-like permease